MREGAQPRLDYSPQSLWSVDRAIEEIRRDRATPYATVDSLLRDLGAYAGEVIVRRTGAEWWATGGDHWIRTPDGRLWDPIDEARRCFAGDGSLRLLCLDAEKPGVPFARRPACAHDATPPSLTGSAPGPGAPPSYGITL
jgi:hypothetical protein